MNKFYLSAIFLISMVFESNTSAGLRQAGNAARNACRNFNAPQTAQKIKQGFAAQRANMNLYGNQLKQGLAQKWQSAPNDLRSAAQEMSKYTQNLSSGVKDTAGVIGITAAGLLACDYKKNAQSPTNSAELTPEDIALLQQKIDQLRTEVYEDRLKRNQEIHTEQREKIQREFQNEIDATIRATETDKQVIKNIDEQIKNLQGSWYDVATWWKNREQVNKLKKNKADYLDSIALMDDRVQAIRDSEQEELSIENDEEQSFKDRITKLKGSLEIDKSDYFLQPKVKDALIERIILANQYPELDPFSVTFVHVVVRNPDGSIKQIREGDISELNSEQLEQIKKGQFTFQEWGETAKTFVTGNTRRSVPMIIIDARDDRSEAESQYIRRAAPIDRYGTEKSLDPKRGVKAGIEYIERIYPYTPEEQQERIKEFEELREKSNEKFQALSILDDPKDFERILSNSNLKKKALQKALRNQELCDAFQNNTNPDEYNNYYSSPEYVRELFGKVKNNNADVADVAQVRSLKQLLEKRNQKVHDFFERAADQN